MWLTDKEQDDLLNEPGPITNRIKKGIVLALQEMGIVEKLNITAEDAHKAWQTARRIEKRELRAKAAASSSYQMEVVDE